MNVESLEHKLYNQQYRLIKEKYGLTAAQNANYGWGVTGDDNFVDVATKVYLHEGHQILSSYADVRGKITHHWSDYT